MICVSPLAGPGLPSPDVGAILGEPPLVGSESASSVEGCQGTQQILRGEGSRG